MVADSYMKRLQVTTCNIESRKNKIVVTNVAKILQKKDCLGFLHTPFNRQSLKMNKMCHTSTFLRTRYINFLSMSFRTSQYRFMQIITNYG